MDEFFDKLKQDWNSEKGRQQPDFSQASVAERARQYRLNSIRFQWGNILVLTITLLLITWWFYRFLLYGTWLSKVGFLLMVIPLLLRILAEVQSVLKAQSMRPDTSMLEGNQRAAGYVRYRKWLHGPVTLTVMALYTIGFYMLMPQFATLVPAWLIALMCLAYPVAAFLIARQVRQKIREEKQQLEWLAAQHNELVQRDEEIQE